MRLKPDVDLNLNSSLNFKNCYCTKSCFKVVLSQFVKKINGLIQTKQILTQKVLRKTYIAYKGEWLVNFNTAMTAFSCFKVSGWGLDRGNPISGLGSFKPTLLA